MRPERACGRVRMVRMPARAGSSCGGVLVVAALLAGCAGTDAGDDAASAPTVTVSPPRGAEPIAPTPLPTPTEDAALVVNVTVTDGEVTGDTGRVEVPLGMRVRLTVVADSADEIHVHGFDLREPVAPGQPSVVEFVADRPGVFEVELHDAGQVLTRLQVQ
jgi:hypothetical protein